MFHKVSLIGHLGQEPQLRYTPDGIPVCNISVATKESISKRLPTGDERSCPQGWTTSQNGKNWELTTWFRVALWRGLAETANQYLHKGSQVFIEGTMSGEASGGSQEPRVWTANDGAHRASYEITARTMKMLGGNRNGDAGSTAPVEYEEEDPPLPF